MLALGPLQFLLYKHAYLRQNIFTHLLLNILVILQRDP